MPKKPNRRALKLDVVEAIHHQDEVGFRLAQSLDHITTKEQEDAVLDALGASRLLRNALAALLPMLLVLLLSGCSANPKTWRPSLFNPPPDVPEDVSRQCMNAAMSDLQRSWPESPGSRAGFTTWEKDERDCTLLRYLYSCVAGAFAAESATGFRVRPEQPGWGRWQDFLREAIANTCEPDGGGTPRAIRLAEQLESSAEQAGSIPCVPCQ